MKESKKERKNSRDEERETGNEKEAVDAPCFSVTRMRRR